MRIAVLSGKGGTGKTFVAVNLATVAKQAVYIDCDVEEPNGRLFLKPSNVTETVVTRQIPCFDATKCIGCRACVDFCHFNALVFIKNKPMVFADICHACGGCALVCPSHAITQTQKPVGTVSVGHCNDILVVTGCLNIGEASGIPVIQQALRYATQDGCTIIDCPPGSACSVMESIQCADYCILVAEPTAFGLHNIKMVYELACLQNKPCGVIINKAMGDYTPIEDFCAQHAIPILCRIPYSEHLAQLSANGQVAALHNADVAKQCSDCLATICKEGCK